jgi:hypothetical protein
LKLEAVIVCNQYADFLEHTLAHNLDFLDHVVVVTTPEDKATQALCSKFSVDMVDTHVFSEDGHKMNKGRAINLGLAHLRFRDWILHVDADILLPPRFRSMLHFAKLDKRNIYGADRLNSRGFENWMRHRDKIVPQYKFRYLVTPQDEFPMGSRLLHKEYGWCPIGYFQLWHHSAGRHYPVHQGSAEHTDVLFSVQWDRENRILLPEFFVYHLESEKSPTFGANWNGRKTPPFGVKGHDSQLELSVPAPYMKS